MTKESLNVCFIRALGIVQLDEFTQPQNRNESAMQQCCAKNRAEFSWVEDDRDKCKTRMKLGNELQDESKEDICEMISLKHKTKEEYFMIVFSRKKTKRNDRKTVLVTWSVHIIIIIKADLFGRSRLASLVLPQLFRFCLFVVDGLSIWSSGGSAVAASHVLASPPHIRQHHNCATP